MEILGEKRLPGGPLKVRPNLRWVSELCLETGKGQAASSEQGQGTHRHSWEPTPRVRAHSESQTDPPRLSLGPRTIFSCPAHPLPSLLETFLKVRTELSAGKHHMSRPPVLVHPLAPPWLSLEPEITKAGRRGLSYHRKDRNTFGRSLSFLPTPPIPHSPASPVPACGPPQFVTHLFPKFMALQDHSDRISSICRRTGPQTTLKGFLPPESRGRSFPCWPLQCPAQALGQSGPP